MDGRGRFLDNIFIERLWRSLKHEDIYLKHYADGREARAGIASWIAFYNGRRPHQGLGYQTPMSVWRLGTTDARREGCGHDASLGQRWRVAHMPTAATAASLACLRMRRKGAAELPIKIPGPMVLTTGSTSAAAAGANLSVVVVLFSKFLFVIP